MLTLRRIALATVLVGCLAAVACATSSAPKPSVTPAVSTAAPAPAQPSGSSSSPGAPAASADWKDEWDRTVAAAKKEGKVIVAGGPGELYRTAVAGFRKAYPEIELEFTGVQGSSYGPKIIAEREGGQYLWDLHLGGTNSPFATLIPKNVLDPLRPALLLPEVLDNSKWQGGFEEGFVDRDRQRVFQFEGRLTYLAHVNRDLAPESELSTVDQLLDPRWKGRIASGDPRVTGAPATFNGYVIATKGEEFVRKLLQQDLQIIRDARQMLEGLIRGRYPIALGVASADIRQFSNEGLTGNISPLEPDAEAARRLTGGFGNVMLINKAPHPNAAKVFVNWLLTREAQQAYVDVTENASRRLDVTGGVPGTQPRPDVKYLNVGREELDHYNRRAIELAKEIIK